MQKSFQFATFFGRKLVNRGLYFSNCTHAPS
jgi:hypothetical protein